MSAQTDACVNSCTVVGSCLCSSGGSLLLSLVGLSVVDSIKLGRAVVALDKMSYGGTGSREAINIIIIIIIIVGAVIFNIIVGFIFNIIVGFICTGVRGGLN